MRPDYPKVASLVQKLDTSAVFSFLSVFISLENHSF